MTDVWLEHVGLDNDGHGGKFLCPEGAVDAWRAMGWEPAAEPPEEVNPVVAENLAAQKAEAERLEAAEQKSTEQAAKAATDTPEGN